MLFRVSFFFPSWEHIIVSKCFCGSWGYRAFLVLSFLSLALLLCDQTLCGRERGFKDASSTETPGKAGPDIFPVCQAAQGSSLGVSVTHSFVLRPRAKRPVIHRSIFHGQNIKAPTKLNIQLRRKSVGYNSFCIFQSLPYNFSLSPSSSPLYCDINFISPPPQIRDSFSC